MGTASRRTTTLGIVGILTTVLAAAKALLDNDPTTNPDWTMVISSITAGIGLVFARDNKVSSEEAGVK